MRLGLLLKRTINTGLKMAPGQIQALVLCGPSGSGKSTLIQKLYQDYPNKFGFSVSHTTRSPRPQEIDGVHYHFTSKEEMENAVRNGDFVEYAVYSNNMYGTSKKSLENVVKGGKVCILDIDVQGVKQIKKTDLKAIYVFLKPPSLEALKKRLELRGTETEETLQKRLDAAKQEIEFGETPNNFDLVLVNDTVEKSYSLFKEFVLEQLAKQGNHGDAD